MSVYTDSRKNYRMLEIKMQQTFRDHEEDHLRPAGEECVRAGGGDGRWRRDGGEEEAWRSFECWLGAAKRSFTGLGASGWGGILAIV